MAGTRLVIHATFVVELLFLVTASFLYASNQKHNPLSSAEPFLADQSGWKILVEDVSSPDDEGFIASFGGFATAAVSQISSLMGMEVEQPVYHDRKIRTSAFVQEIQQKIAEYRVVDDGQSKFLPPLRVNLRTPQVTSSALVISLAESLENGFQRRSKVRVGIAENDSDTDMNLKSCDDFQLPIQSRRNHTERKVQFPEIVLLMDCSSATIPNDQSTHVEVDESEGMIMVRTKASANGGNELQNHLENDIAGELLPILFIDSSPNEYRLGSVSINLIDEDPMSHAADGFTAKSHFDMIGKALSASVQKTLSPLLNDLSFIYGGKVGVDNSFPALLNGSVIKGMNVISQEVHSSAYLPLPDDIIESDRMVDESSNYISPDNMANWLIEHSPRKRRNSHSTSIPGNVEWTLFVPAKEHNPLMVSDDPSGVEGESIILSPPPSFGERMVTHPNGVSIVNLADHSMYVDLDKAYHSYMDRISSSLVYLVGYVRAIHGLPTKTRHPFIRGRDGHLLSFWELESIARSHYSSTLERVFDETDTLLAVLHQHSWTLAFPQEVAHKLNNATYLLRQSTTLVEQGYPTLYAISLLHGSLQYLESVQSDHQFHELPYFAPDHYLAVFSPLVLPLFLPMIAGLVREVKRFRDLQKKKNVTPL